MKGFNIIALDEKFEIVSLIRYTLLQWNRKYHEPGTFSMQIPLRQYKPNIKYLYTSWRPEMGEVSQINYINEDGYKSVYLSGYFLENQLNRRIVYPKPFTTNITNNPSWVFQEGKAEDVAFQFFNAFKDIIFTHIHTPSDPPIKCLMDIASGTSQHRGNIARHERNGEFLGNKIYSILKPSGLSCRVEFDFQASKKTFNIWGGLDRTDLQNENNPVIFSTKYGNIKNPNVLMDNTSYKNAVIAKSCFQNGSGQEITYVKGFVPVEKESDYDDIFIYNETALNRSDYDEDLFDDAVENESLLLLNEYGKVINVQFDAMEGSYEYLKDFDLGDLVSIEIPEIGISGIARLIGCYEVMKKGVATLTMEFGTPIIIGGM